MKSPILFSIIIIAAALSGCTARGGQTAASADSVAVAQDSVKTPYQSVAQPIRVAAEDTASYMPLLRGKRVALTANPTAQAFGKHLLLIQRISEL